MLWLCAWYADTAIPPALVMQGAEEELGLPASFGRVAPLLCRLLLPHQRTLHPYSAAGRVADLWDLVGNFLQLSGNAAGALPLYRRALESYERLLGPDHPSSRTIRAHCDQIEHEVVAA